MKNRINYNKKYYYYNKEKILEQNKKYRKINKKQIRIKNIKIMDNLKINGCAICGYDKNNRALHFHHVNRNDKCFGLMIGNINRNNKYIIDEINKCILLCANCHYEIEDKEVKEMNKINKEGDDL